MPVFVQLLDSSDEDVQFYCAAALSNLAVHGRSERKNLEKVLYLSFSLSLCAADHRKAIVAAGDGRVLKSLITLMGSKSEKVGTYSCKLFMH